ncbi:winged helix-turn-helix transcriptional regulator [Roseibium denhamense]
MALRLLERNPGHGHPLRPECRLTPIGQEAASLAHEIQGLAQDEDRDLLRRAWTLPVLTSLHQPRFFNDLRRTLPQITDRALSKSLQSMEERQWVFRQVLPSTRPPRPLYSSINLGKRISEITAPQVLALQDGP